MTETNNNRETNREIKIIDLEPNSEKYKKIVEKVEETTYSLNVTKIQKIENPSLLEQYNRRKRKRDQQNYLTEEDILYHGTKKKNLESICRNNFDLGRKGENSDLIYGQGVYFTRGAFYAWFYTDQDDDDIIIRTKVQIGKSQRGNKTITAPSEGYDTTTNGESLESRNFVAVKYNSSEFYPEYVIHLQRKREEWTHEGTSGDVPIEHHNYPLTTVMDCPLTS